MDLIQYIEQKEKQMNETMEIVDVEQKAKECEVHPYFMLDILSGDFIGIFSVKNDETAVRTFCMNMDNFPENLVHDTVLCKYDDRTIVFEGKEYLKTWKEKQAAKSNLPHFVKGVNHAS